MTVKKEVMMKKVAIYEPAMCCPTGLCGVGIDSELLRISTVLNQLKEKGINIERVNLTNAPMKFVTNKTVNAMINDIGPEALPYTLVEDEIVMTGRYPTNEELEKLFNVSLASA